MNFLIHMLVVAAVMVSMFMAKPQFSGDFWLDNLIVESPFQGDLKSTSNTTVSFTFGDQDVLDNTHVHCSVEWAVGLSPPYQAQPGACEKANFNVWFPEGTYHGTKNFTMTLSHTVVDDSVGEYPYNRVTKFADINMTFPGTPNYECDATGTQCKSCNGTEIIAKVTTAIA